MGILITQELKVLTGKLIDWLIDWWSEWVNEWVSEAASEWMNNPVCS